METIIVVCFVLAVLLVGLTLIMVSEGLWYSRSNTITTAVAAGVSVCTFFYLLYATRFVYHVIREVV